MSSTTIPWSARALRRCSQARAGSTSWGSPQTGEEAIALAGKTSPDVVLSDVRMPKMDGFTMLSHMLKVAPSARVILLAGMPLREEEARAEAEGAAGYLPKDVDQDRLSEAIKIAAAGGAFVREQFQSTPSLLTVREMDVLRLLAQGKQRDQIAAALGIGAESVKTHLKGIMNKLACPNATSAVGRAYELGILRA